jgi:hypothetical protein
MLEGVNPDVMPTVVPLLKIMLVALTLLLATALCFWGRSWF